MNRFFVNLLKDQIKVKTLNTAIMDRIVLEVDDTAGKIYRNLSLESKQQLNQTISLMLKKAVNDATFTEYSKLLDDIGTEAVKNGLTPEILEALLASDDYLPQSPPLITLNSVRLFNWCSSSVQDTPSAH